MATSDERMIYLDHNATAPMLAEVRDAMLPWLRGVAGNASSLHAVGRRARAAVESAREDVAALIGGDPQGVHFCSGGTEADVWALRGSFGLHGSLRQGHPAKKVLVISAVEHPAIRNTATRLAAAGVEVRILEVDTRGRLLPFSLAQDVSLVALMAANNEIGNLYDVRAMAEQARSVGAHMHSDLVQAAGKIPVDVREWGVHTAALSAHKLGGPQGIGALYIEPGIELASLLTGGGQENGMRSGTENIAGIVGFAAAARLAKTHVHDEYARQASLRDGLARDVVAAVPGTVELGDATNRLPNTLSLAFTGIAGEALVMRLDAVGIAASTGSACSSGSGKPSEVLVAMGLEKWQIKGALRLSLGPSTSATDIQHATRHVIEAARSLQSLSAQD